MSSCDEAPVSWPNESNATLFDLPLFIREQIYGYVFAGKTINVHVNRPKRAGVDSVCWERSKIYRDGKIACPTMAIAQTCKVLRAEALPRLYRSAMFRLRGDGPVQQRTFELCKGKVSSSDEEDKEEKEDKSKDDKHETDLALEIRICTISETLKSLQRLELHYRSLPSIGWDARSWTWSSAVHEPLPQLKELHIWFPLDCCIYGPDFHWSRHFHPDTGEYSVCPRESGGPPTISNGEVLSRLSQRASRRFTVKFKIEMFESCVLSGYTRISIDPDAEPEPKVEVISWCYVDIFNDMLVDLLDEYGLPDAASEMKQMVEQIDAEVEEEAARRPPLGTGRRASGRTVEPRVELWKRYLTDRPGRLSIQADDV